MADTSELLVGSVNYSFEDTTARGGLENRPTVSEVIDLIYPVGSIYLSVTDSTVASVQARFGGTWERISEGKALFGYSTTDTDFQTIGSGGGNKAVNLQHTHGFASNSVVGNTTLTAAQSGIPAHAHTVPTHGHGMTQPAFTVDKSISNSDTMSSSGGHSHTIGARSSAYGQAWRQLNAWAVGAGSGFSAVGWGGDAAWVVEAQSNSGAHTHSIPKHSHTLTRSTNAAVNDKSAFDTNNNTAKDATSAHNHSLSSVTTNSQLSTTQDILNPYITVYMYKRTA